MLQNKRPYALAVAVYLNDTGAAYYSGCAYNYLYIYSAFTYAGRDGLVPRPCASLRLFCGGFFILRSAGVTAGFCLGSCLRTTMMPPSCCFL